MEKVTVKGPKITEDQFGNMVKSMDNETIKVTLSAEDIRNYDGDDLSPQLVIELKRLNPETTYWETFFETELAAQSKTAEFKKKLSFKFRINRNQKMRCQLYDKRNGGNFLIGENFISLGEIVGSENSTLEMEMKRETTIMGKTILKAKRGSKELCYFGFQIKGIELTNFGMMNTINPFIKLWRPKLTSKQLQQLKEGKTTGTDLEIKEWEGVYEAFGKDGANSVFRRGILGCHQLCYNSWDCPLRIEVYNHKGKFAGVKFKGGAIFTLNELVRDKKTKVRLFEKKKCRSAGDLEFIETSFISSYGLSDYLLGGMNLSYDFFVNFSQGNIQLKEKVNLHDKTDDNPYIKSMTDIYEILSQFSKSKEVGMYAFGGKPKIVDQCYFEGMGFYGCQGIMEPTQVTGTEQIIKAYNQCKEDTELGDINKINDILSYINSKVEGMLENEKEDPVYHILFVMTPVDIESIEIIQKELIRGSKLPLSIIFIDVGEGVLKNLSMIETAKCMNVEEEKEVRRMTRSVPYNLISNNDKEQLSEGLLKNIALHMYQYFRIKKIPPPNIERIAPPAPKVKVEN